MALARFNDIATLKADMPTAWFLNPTLRNGVRVCRNLITVENFARWVICAGVCGLETDVAFARM